MPRNNDQLYYHPVGTEAVAGELAVSADVNARFDALKDDANAPRPVKFGGTGGTTPETARTALEVQRDLAKVAFASIGSDLPGQQVGIDFHTSGSVRSARITQSASNRNIYINAGPDLLYNDKLVYNRSNVVGTVNLTDDGSRGAIIESGGSGGGAYTRFADRTQIVSIKDAPGMTNLRRAQFPRSFSTTGFLNVTITPISTTPVVVAINDITVNSVGYRVFDLSGGVAAVPVCILAIGYI